MNNKDTVHNGLNLGSTVYACLAHQRIYCDKKYYHKVESTHKQETILVHTEQSNDHQSTLKHMLHTTNIHVYYAQTHTIIQ